MLCYASEVKGMRTTLDLDGRLLKEAMVRTKGRTKKETVERGLRELLKTEARRRLFAMKGKGYGLSLRTFLKHRLDE